MTEWEYRRGLSDRRSTIVFPNGSVAVVYDAVLCRVLTEEALRDRGEAK